MPDEPVDTGFGDVLAGNIYTYEELTQPHVCANATGGTRCDVCFGPVTATVTEPSELTPEGKQAALELVSMPALTPPELAQLAREMAMNIKPRSLVLADMKLSETQYEFLEKHNDFFAAALKQASVEWNSPLSTQERLKIEAAAILEDSLIGLGARMQNRAEGLPGVTEVAKLFAKIAGVGEREAGAGPSAERFVISIDLGADKTITLSTQAPQEAAPAPRTQLALPAGPAVAGDLGEV